MKRTKLKLAVFAFIALVLVTSTLLVFGFLTGSMPEGPLSLCISAIAGIVTSYHWANVSRENTIDKLPKGGE